MINNLIPEINIKTTPPGTASQKILKEMKRVIGRPNYTGLYGVSLYRGNQCYLEDVDGNVFLDSLACASSCSLGYNQNFLLDAYVQTASKLQQSCFTYSPNKHAINLAAKLIELSPGKFEKRVLIGLSGSDSCDGALKAVRKFTQNDAIIHFKNDYHGSTGLSQPASDFGNLDQAIYPSGPYFIEFDFPTTQQQATAVLDKINECLKKNLAGGVICEAIQGDAGVIIPPAGFIKKLRLITADTEKLLIIDEVQSGMGRTGKWWSFEYDDVIPDLFITAKGLSGGYIPISAVVGRKDVLDSLDPGQHIFTYGGHPPSCAVALKVLEYIDSQNLLENVLQTGNYLITELKKIQLQFPNIITDVRGRGLMIGMEINISVFALAGKVFATRCMEKGVYVGFFGANAQVVRIEPPLIITKKEAALIVETIKEVATEMREGKIPVYTYENVNKYSIGI